MPNYDDLSKNLRSRMGVQPPGGPRRTAKTNRTSQFELVFEAVRKEGRELLQFGVDRLNDPVRWAISIAHSPANTEGTPLPLREIWVAPDQATPMLDLLELGIPRLMEKPARPAGSPNSREEIGTIDGPHGNQLQVVLQGYGTRWNLKVTGPGDEWLPFDERDFGAFLEGFAMAFERLGQLDDGIPF